MVEDSIRGAIMKSMIRLKELRCENKLSQTSLANKIGSSQKAVDYWEKGKAQPTLGFLMQMADVLHCSIDYLCGREDDYGVINLDSNLSNEEQILFSLFRRCTKEQRNEIIEFAKFKNKDN